MELVETPTCSLYEGPRQKGTHSHIKARVQSSKGDLVVVKRRLQSAGDGGGGESESAQREQTEAVAKGPHTILTQA